MKPTLFIHNKSSNIGAYGIIILIVVASSAFTTWYTYQQSLQQAYINGERSIGNFGYIDGFANGSAYYNSAYDLAYPNGYTTGYYAGYQTAVNLQTVTTGRITPTINGLINQWEWIKGDYYNIPKYFETMDGYTSGYNYLSIGYDFTYLYIAVDMPSMTLPYWGGSSWATVALNTNNQQFTNLTSFNSALNNGVEIGNVDFKTSRGGYPQTIFNPINTTDAPTNITLSPNPNDLDEIDPVVKNYGVINGVNFTSNWMQAEQYPSDNNSYLIQMTKYGSSYGASLQLQTNLSHEYINTSNFLSNGAIDLKFTYLFVTNGVWYWMPPTSALALVNNQYTYHFAGSDPYANGGVHSSKCISAGTYDDLTGEFTINLDFVDASSTPVTQPTNYYLALDYIGLGIPFADVGNSTVRINETVGLQDVKFGYGYGATATSNTLHWQFTMAIPLINLYGFGTDHPIRIFVQMSQPKNLYENIGELQQGSWFGTNNGDVLNWRSYWQIQLGQIVTVLR